MAGEDLTAIINVVLNDEATAGLRELPAAVGTTVTEVNARLAQLGGGEDPFAKLQASLSGGTVALAGLGEAAVLVRDQLALAAEAAIQLNGLGGARIADVGGIDQARQLNAELNRQLVLRRELLASGAVPRVVNPAPVGAQRSRDEATGRIISAADVEARRTAAEAELVTVRAITRELERQIGVATVLDDVARRRAANDARDLAALKANTTGSGPVVGGPPVNPTNAVVTGLLRTGATEENALLGARSLGFQVEAEQVALLKDQLLAAAAATGNLAAGTELLERRAQRAAAAAEQEAAALNAVRIASGEQIIASPLAGFTGANARQQAQSAAAAARAEAAGLQLQVTRGEITSEEELAAVKERVILLNREAAAITTALAEAKALDAEATSTEAAAEARLAQVAGLVGEAQGVVLERTLALAAAEEKLARVNSNTASSYEQLLAAQRAVLTQTRLLETAQEKAAITAAATGGGSGGGFGGGVVRGLGGNKEGGFTAFEVGKQIGEVAKYIYLYEAFIKLTEGIKEAIKNTEEFERSVTTLTDVLGTNRDSARATGEQLAAIGAIGGLAPAKSVEVGVQFARTFQGQADPASLLQQGANIGTQLSVLTGQDAGKQLEDATATVRGFNLSFADTTRVIDAATFAAQKFGFANAADVLPGLGQIADIAKAAGFSVEQTAALVADVRARTGETSEAAAGELRRIFGRQGGNAFQQVFTTFGVDRSQSFDKEIEQLAAKYETLNSKQKAFITTQFGGGRAGTAATAFLEDYGKITETAAGALDHAGISQKQFTERLNDVVGIIKTVGGEFKLIGVQLGESGVGTGIGVLLIGLKDLLTVTSDLLGVFDAIPAPIRDAAFFFGELFFAAKGFRALGLQNLVLFGGAGRAATRAAAAAEGGAVAGGAAAAGAAGATAVGGGAITEVSAAEAAAIEAAGANLVEALALVAAELETVRASELRVSADLDAASVALGEALAGLTDEQAARVVVESAITEGIATAGAGTAAALQITAERILIASQEITAAGRIGLGQGLAARGAIEASGAARTATAVEGAEIGAVARAGLTRAGGALGGTLSALFSSPLLVGIIGAAVTDAFVRGAQKNSAAGRSLSEAAAFQPEGNGLLDKNSIDSQIALAGQAKQKIEDASGGVIGSILNFITGGGDAAKKAADQLIAELKDEKQKLAVELTTEARGTSPSSVLDFSSADGVKNGVAGLQQEGRSATTIFQSLVEGLRNLNVQAAAAANGGLVVLPQTINKVVNQLAQALQGAPAAGGKAFADAGGTDVPFAPDPGSPLQNVDTGRLNKFLTSALKKDLIDLGIDPESGGTLSADQVAQLKQRAIADVEQGLIDQGKGASLGIPAIKAQVEAAAGKRVADIVNALNSATDAAKGIITPQNVSEAIAAAGKNATAAGAESGNAAALSGTGPAGLTAANQTQSFLASLLDQARQLQAANPDLVTDGQLEQLKNLKIAADLNVIAQTQAHLDVLAKLAESTLPPTDKIGRAAAQLANFKDKLAIETDPDKQAAIQTSINDLQFQQQQNAVEAANAAEKASVDPRNTVGVAQAALDAAVRQVKLLQSEGDTKSAAFFDALGALQGAEIGLANAQVQAANAGIEAGVASGDALGEANAKVLEAVNTLRSQAPGTSGYATALRAYHDAVFAAAQAAAQQANAQAEADVFPGDAYGEAKAKVNEARRDLAATTVGTTEYYKALRAYEDSLVAFANAQRDAAKTAFLLASGTFTDPLTQANADVAAARAKLNADKKGTTFRTPDTIIKGTPGTAAIPASQAQIAARDAAQAAVNADQAQVDSLFQQRDAQLTFLRGNGTAANPQFGGAQNYKDQKKAFDDVINQYQARLNQERATLAQATKDAQGQAATPGTPDRVIQGTTRTIKATAEQIAADQLALAQALQAAKEAAAQLANAKIEAGETDVSSKVDAARNAVVEATNTLNADQKTTTKYFQDLAALHKAQEALAQALRDAAKDAAELTGDTTDPVFEAILALNAAKAKLAADVARKAKPDTINADKLAVENAAQAAQKTAFQQQFDDQRTARDLGQESNAAYLAYLQGQDKSLRAQLAAMKKGSEGYRQRVEELNQIDQAIQATSASLSGQFNLGDIKLPTVYEVRRSLAASQNGGSVIDSSVQNIYTTINGADFAAVVNYLQGVLGTGALTVATTGRKI